MKSLMLIAAAALFLSPAAFAKGKGSVKTHHCEVNGAEVAKTKKACKKAGGTWAKGAPAAAPAAAAK